MSENLAYQGIFSLRKKGIHHLKFSEPVHILLKLFNAFSASSISESVKLMT